MSESTQEGVLLILLSVTVAVLWVRGYLTAWIQMAADAIVQPPAKQPFAFPGATTGIGSHRMKT